MIEGTRHFLQALAALFMNASAAIADSPLGCALSLVVPEA
jgi:hypothetical protein